MLINAVSCQVKRKTRPHNSRGQRLSMIKGIGEVWEKEMATHSSVLAWRIPGTGRPGGLPSMGSHRVGHD